MSYFFFFGQDDFNGKFECLSISGRYTTRAGYARWHRAWASDDVNSPLSVSCTLTKYFAGIGCTNTDSDPPAQHLTTQTTKAGSLNFVNHAVANHIGDKPPNGTSARPLSPR